MVSNRLSHCRLEMAEEEPRGAAEKRKVRMENGKGRRRLEMTEGGNSKRESGEDARAGVPLRVRSVRVNVVRPVPRVPVRMQGPQRG